MCMEHGKVLSVGNEKRRRVKGGAVKALADDRETKSVKCRG